MLYIILVGVTPGLIALCISGLAACVRRGSKLAVLRASGLFPKAEPAFSPLVLATTDLTVTEVGMFCRGVIV
ncbi:MAG: hypothetical protein N3G20_11095, partial [Verrucomicrobiae bacterium]|nr:hypothetical protein [Verrucomicrobiae bacterium]